MSNLGDPHNEFRRMCADSGLKSGSILVAMSNAPYKRDTDKLLWALTFCGYVSETDPEFFNPLLKAYRRSYK